LFISKDIKIFLRYYKMLDL